MITVIFGIIGFMMISFLFIPYADIATYLMFNIAIDGIGILLLIFLVNLRVWRYISGRTFYAIDIHKSEGTVDSELWVREGYFEVDLDKIEENMDPEQVKILRENERAIALLKRAVGGVNEIAAERKEKRREERAEKRRVRDRIMRRSPTESDDSPESDSEENVEEKDIVSDEIAEGPESELVEKDATEKSEVEPVEDIDDGK